MFREELSHYIRLPKASKEPEFIVDTRNFYEFSMPALHVDGEWYALVESPDSSRIADIDEVILEEFGAKVLGWCVLKEHQKEVGATLLPFAKGEDKLEAITFDSDSNSYWLLKIEPSLNSRLNQARKV